MNWKIRIKRIVWRFKNSLSKVILFGQKGMCTCQNCTNSRLCHDTNKFIRLMNKHTIFYTKRIGFHSKQVYCFPYVKQDWKKF